MRPLFWVFSALMSVLLLLGDAQLLQARPVSHAGGYTAMGSMSSTGQSLHVHYSPSVKYSLGYRAESYRQWSSMFQGAQLNILLIRLNGEASQANVYFKGAAGMQYALSHSDITKELEPAGFAGLAADWETRRYFVRYEGRLILDASINHMLRQSFRLGIAPYLGDYGELHTWFMGQLDYITATADSHSIVVTPLVRFFYHTYLFEFGISHHGGVLFNFIVRT
ncbi:MAG: hypothetical protein OXC44_04615 [Proteobacteria bacterium]|nr:hypothetical protein [Pseudomonadota bacterium]